MLDRYAAATGVTLDTQALRFFQRRWDLDDLVAFVAELRGPHRDTPDSRASLGYLRGVLQSLAALTP